MDVSCVIVLALSVYVTAIPHEYAKTGAVAKAEANAVAGGFGTLPVIPLSIPSGAGYSGSFSKTSSSSFASSSSSARSSSSSYSFSSDNGISGSGCNTGLCKGGESNAPSKIIGSPNGQITYTHQSSEAQAAAAANAASQSSSYVSSGNIAPCQSGNCVGLNSPIKCVTGQCGQSSEGFSSNAPGSDTSKQTSNSESLSKCSTGNCFPVSNQPIDSPNNSDDIEVNAGGNSKTNSETDYSSTNPQFDNVIQSSTFSPEKNSPKCKTPNCDTFLPLSPTYNLPSSAPEAPATHLVTPNFRPICTSHNCKPDGSTPDDIKGKPSSYNVPILGMNPSFRENGPLNPSIIPLSNIPSSSGYETNCGSNGCGSNRHPNIDNGLKTPKYSHVYNAPFPCTTPNCGSSSQPSEINPGWTNKLNPNVLPTQGNVNAPTYSNTIGSAAGFTTLYPGIIGSTQKGSYYFGNQNGQSYSNGLNTPKVPLGTHVFPSVLSTNKPTVVTESGHPKYTGGFGGPEGPVDAAIRPGSLITPKPNLDEAWTESNLPKYTGGFGGPSGSVTASLQSGQFTTPKPNLNVKPIHETVYNGGFNGINPTQPILNTNPSGIAVPTQFNTGAPVSPASPNNFASNVGHPTPVNVYNPQSPVNDKEKLPQYTGGFGGPSGILNPNEFKMPPTVSSPFVPCTTTDCRPNAVLNKNHNNAEASATAMANAKEVTYTGGFGGPSGLLEPSEKDKNIHKFNQKQERGDSDVKNDNNNQKTPTNYFTGSQDNSGLEKFGGNGGNKQNIPSTETNFHVQNNQSPSKDISEKDKELNDYIKQANIAGASASAGAQADAHSTSSDVGGNGNSDDENMLNDYITQANIGGAIAGAGAQANLHYVDNFTGLSGSNGNRNSGCNVCGLNSNSGAAAGATASAKSLANAGSWATGTSFASGSATAHATAGAAVNGAYGR